MYNDPKSEDFRRLIGEDHNNLSGEEKYERLKEILDFDTFAPTEVPENLTCEKYNPAIEGYQNAGLSWGVDGWEPVDNTEPLRKYPAYVPTDAAIETLRSYEPLLEVGAGNGYWAHVVNENGGVCLPTDIRPEQVDATEFPSTYTVEGVEGEYTVWSDVREFDAVDAIQKHPDRTVVLCHPSGATRWSEDVLHAIEDQYFIFIGGWYPSPDATPMFFNTLATNWNLVSEFPVYDWASMHAHGYVFKRK